MIRSDPVVVEGRLLGIVVAHQAGWHFIAADPVVGDLHGQIFPHPDEARRIAGLVFTRGRALPPTLPVLRPAPTLRLVSDEDG